MDFKHLYILGILEPYSIWSSYLITQINYLIKWIFFYYKKVEAVLQ